MGAIFYSSYKTWKNRDWSIDIRIFFDFSYIPRNTHPPRLIQTTRGPIPLNRPFHPSFLKMYASDDDIFEYAPLFPSVYYFFKVEALFTITRVFTTSSGVVTAAAIPPDIDPAIPASHGSAIRFL
ncbi:hypothetical protein AYI69_g252 [Smittium culicis]|uniref:Uncharacterized protein n=1 Tax=Smittium culicis TaxID=133412 RepID=A0A1R1YTP2_9FUNG|nr:hypothetical protein AYI69_g252 [Smittium culicis]